MSIRNLIAGVLIAGVLLAQEPAKPTVPEEIPKSDIVVEYNFVTAPVVVHDARGNVVTGLNPLDFELYDNGKLQKITEDATTHPISMVVAVQSSANMEKLLPGIRKIGSLFSGLVLGENGEMAVLSFDHRVQTMTEFTSDPNKISDAFKNIKIGSTPNHVNDAAMKGVNMLRTRDKARRRVLMLISETRDNGSSMGVRDVLTEAEFKDITVYAVEVSHLLTSLTTHPQAPRTTGIPPEARHLPAGIIGTPTTDAQQNMGDYSPIIKEIFTAVKAIFISNPQEVYTRYTGGREYSYMTQKGLEQAITDIGNDIHSSYLLTYLPNNPEDAGYHEIEVRILKPGLKVTARPGYWSAAKPQ
ncbi:MAG: VWA domain-containing protein [Acidobacteriia bacterium]|nr:VWA domain-containing protein [Terriglobia bacterium]